MAHEWTWVAGASTVGASAQYGTLGTAAVGNTPGPRVNFGTWTDLSGKLWLLGGSGVDSGGTPGDLNDLWRFDPATGLWAWMGGSQLVNASGLYSATTGTASTSYAPGARVAAVTWVDGAGKFWLFGGYGYDSLGNTGLLNDLWKYDPGAGTWTWVSGSKSTGAMANYGTQNTPAGSNVPGPREQASGWVDTSGNLWLFGGQGNDSVPAFGDLNDLWEFNPSLGTGGQWIWIAGANVVNQGGNFGSITPPATGQPGARQEAAAWTDGSGNFWLFGGSGYDANGVQGSLNDLWEYSGGQWTWIGGASLQGAVGNYGTQGVAAGSNIPGARTNAVQWTDTAGGNLWLMGGNGYDAQYGGRLDDLWKYNIAAAKWTWVSGYSSRDQAGSYGTKALSAPSNEPGGRYNAGAWLDGSGNLWLLGGSAIDSAGTIGNLNDLWEYLP